MKLDLHIHSSYSLDGSDNPKEIIKHARKIGLDGIAITDHNEIKGSLEAIKYGKTLNDFVVVPGIEVSSLDGHLIGLGMTESVEKGLPTKETIELITDQGGIVIASHPYRFWSGLGDEIVKSNDFTAVEVMNARSLRKDNRRALKLANELALGRTGGSDCHSLDQIGKAYTELEISNYDIDDIIQEIENKKSQGKGSHRSISGTIGYTFKCVFLWLGRGMKKM